jgi:poly(3-hydroxybutyrate) depolymerase
LGLGDQRDGLVCPCRLQKMAAPLVLMFHGAGGGARRPAPAPDLADRAGLILLAIDFA